MGRMRSMMNCIALAAVAAAACGAPSGAAPPDTGPGSDAAIADDPFAALQALPATCSRDGWCWRSPRPAGNDYSRVYATAGDNIWLLGQHSTVMQWNGHTWTSHQPPLPAGQSASQFPFAISGRGPADMWLIFGAAIEHWDGSTWTVVESLTAGSLQFNTIWAAPGGDVWVTLSNGSLRRSSNGGKFQSIDAGCNQCFLGSIWGVAPDDFFITTLPAGILHYDGQKFTRSYAGPLIAGSYLGTHGDVWVAGADGALLHWNGTAWTAVPTGRDTWTLTGVTASASDDVWWWASRSSAESAFLHWDGAALTTVPVDTRSIGAFLYSGAVIDGRWWLVGGAGAVYTRSGPDTITPIIEPQVSAIQRMWGSAADNMYFATGGEIRHWDGQTTTAIPIAANQISGVRTDGVDELFATGFDVSADRLRYIARAYHFDGLHWTGTKLNESTLAEHHYIAQVVALGPGEAMAVGYGGIAFHYSGGEWTPVATGVTTNLTGVWGPDADHLWITGAAGTLLTWSRSTPGVATRDTSLPPLTADLGAIHGADGIAWITAGDQVLMHTAAGWSTQPAGLAAASVFAIDATNVVVSSAGQASIARWNGSRFVLEDSASGLPTPVLFRPPGGPMLAGWLSGIVQHP